MLGRTPTNITAIRPMKDGVIADFTVTEKMLQYFIHKVHESRLIRPSPRVLICVPCGSTQVERRAIKESAAGAGAREVYLIEEPMAAAIGASLPVNEARGSMILTSVAALPKWPSSRSTASCMPIPCVSAATSSTKPSSTMCAATTAASSVKRRQKPSARGGQRPPENEVQEIEVKGRNLAEGIPRSFTLNSNEILEALQEPLSGIVDAVRKALEQTPPELGADVAERGIVLTGGGALLKGLDRLLEEETGLPVIVAEDPMTCVARGGGRALELMDEKAGDFFSVE